MGDIDSFINVVDIEYNVEASIVSGLRAIFKYDTEFTFDPNDIVTKLIISTDFPESDADLKVPQIVVTGMSFNLSQTGLFNNFYSDIIEEGIHTGYEYATQIPYSASMVCLATRSSTSKDLANKLLNYIWFAANEIFNDVLCLNVMNAGKSPGSPQRITPNTAFANTVSIGGVLNWSGRKKFSEANYNLLAKIRLEIK